MFVPAQIAWAYTRELGWHVATTGPLTRREADRLVELADELEGPVR